MRLFGDMFPRPGRPEEKRGARLCRVMYCWHAAGYSRLIGELSRFEAVITDTILPGRYQWQRLLLISPEWITIIPPHIET